MPDVHSASASASDVPASKKEPSTLGRVGIGLLAGGAALAATTAAGATLLEAVTTPDDMKSFESYVGVRQKKRLANIATSTTEMTQVTVTEATDCENQAWLRESWRGTK